MDVPVAFRGGYFGASPKLPPSGLESTIRAGKNVWLRHFGRIEVGKGVSQVSATNVGARLFASNTQRASIAGGLVGGYRLPRAGLLRYENAVIFYLSELASQQVYIDETSVSGLTTSATAGGLRLAVPDGGGGYDVYDAGFDPPVLDSGDVTNPSSGTKSMSGTTGLAICRWRSKTRAVSAPSNIVFKAMTPSSADIFKWAVGASPVTGQDGWVLCGTRWGDQSGDLWVVRYLYSTPRGTFTATNSSPTLAGVDTEWLLDARAGDVWDIDGSNYTIQSVDSNTQITLTGNFTGTTGAGKTASLVTAAADWYNSELGSLIKRDVFKPPVSSGVFQFANRVFLWGCFGESDAPGPVIVPMLEDNPEHVGLTTIRTASGADLINVLVGENRLFLMTGLGLESVAWTGRSDVPFISRVLSEPGFRAATNGVIYQDRFVGFSDKPLMTVAEGNIDTEFAAPVWEDMRNWDGSRVVLAVDPRNEAILFCHYDGVSETEVRPYMTQFGQWGPKHTVEGRIVDQVTVGGELYLTILSGGNYRVNKWEGGVGASGAYVVSQFLDLEQLGIRKRIKALHFAGKGSFLRVYTCEPGESFPDLDNSAAAEVSFALSGTEAIDPAMWTDVQATAVAIRADLPAGGAVHKITISGYGLSERR